MRSEQQVITAIDKYSDMVRRICMMHLKSYADTEDIFQNVFFKYAISGNEFKSEEHEKAWIIRVTVNLCKDLLKSFFRKNTVPLESLGDCAVFEDNEKKEVLQAVFSLPEKYKDVVYLYYYHGYSAIEISQILKKNVNTVYTLLSRAKKLLKEKLGGEDFE